MAGNDGEKEVSENSDQTPQTGLDTTPARRRKPVWPWVVLLLLTLCAIYTYNQVTTVIEAIRHQVPPEFWEVLEWMFRQSGLLPDDGRSAPDFAVVLPDLSVVQAVLLA